MDRKQLAEEINSKTSIVALVGRYVQLTKSGRNHKGLCPFHQEATPSFLVSGDKGIYKCFGCGEGGDGISFVSKMEGISYSEAMTSLAREVGIDRTALKQLESSSTRVRFDEEYALLNFVKGFYQYYLLHTDEGKIAISYLSNRGMTKETIEQFGIGLAPRDGQLLIKALQSNEYTLEVAKKAGLLQQNEQGDYYAVFRDRIMFSILNEQGNVAGFSGRVYKGGQEGYGKYINSPESNVFQKSQLIYHLHEAKKTSRMSQRLLLFEGFLDVIAAHQAGFLESVATMGTALTTDHASILARHAKEVILVFDGDSAGLAATAKAIPLLMSAGLQVSVVSLRDGMDPDDFIRQSGAEQFSKIVREALGALDFQYAYLKQGLNLASMDDQQVYERRLVEAGKQFGVGEQLLWKFRKEEKKHHNNRGNGVPTTRQVRLLVPPSGEVKAEKELIYYMLLDKAVFELVNKRIGTAFNVDAHRRIVQGIEAYYVKADVMDRAEYFDTLEPATMRIVRDIVDESGCLPQKWSIKGIERLIELVQSGAKKLERIQKLERFYQADYEQQLMMMDELTGSE